MTKKRQVWIVVGSSTDLCVLREALYFGLKFVTENMKSRVQYASKKVVTGFDKTIKSSDME